MDTAKNIVTEEELDQILSLPEEETIELMKRLDGDIMILGIGGKMGPTLGITAVRAIRKAGVEKRVIGVSRFSDESLIPKLESGGIECIKCDLLNPEDVAELPDIPNIIFMAGRKFGIKGSDYLTWALNTIVPANVARRFSFSKFVVFSTGSIYDLWPVDSDGPDEEHIFTSIGEYANSCLGRERIFEHYSHASDLKALQYRLNYAIDCRYGVLYEIGRQVFAGETINLTMGYANVIWQGDANNIAIRGLELAESPAVTLNVTGPKVKIREVAISFGKIMGKEPAFEGSEAPKAFLSNTAKLKRLLGAPKTSAEDMIEMIATWIMQGGKTLNKPTHFQVSDGQFLD